MTPAARSRGTRLGRLRAAGPAGAKRTPFVFLVVVLLGSGLISLLVLNSALNQGSFELTKLQRKTTELTDEQQALQQEVDRLAAPDALERRARKLGMIPGGSPAFLSPDGTVRGSPAPAGQEDPANLTTQLAPGPRPAPAPAPVAATGPKPGTGVPSAPAPAPGPGTPPHAPYLPGAGPLPAPPAPTAEKTAPTTGR
ncbi:septum formation initiator family protein [Streptomyces sp. NPDC020379]|uniref:septum formation initiator family protein n=1 Tax=Streptomyces sp. NPDC020379 TaxID=3365071 RepID=UPI0037A5812D